MAAHAPRMTPAQHRASDPAASVWVGASAGTGKTKVLTDRVLRLLLGGTAPERILCLTFTRAAAAEMALRITRELARWPMRIMGLTMPLEAMSFAFMHGLLGAGAAGPVMRVSVGIQWLLCLPLAYAIGPVLGFGLLGVWLWQGGTGTLQALMFLTMWRRRKWQHIEV